MKTFYLVDLENVNRQLEKGLERLSVNDTVIIINNEAHYRISRNLMAALSASHAAKRFVSIHSCEKQALDFCLCTYLGGLINQNGGTACYYIISKDKGYDAAVAFAREEGITIQRKDTIQAALEGTEQEQKRKDAVKELLPDSSKKVVKAVCKALDNATSYQDYHNALQKTFYGTDLRSVYERTKSLVVSNT